MPLSRQKRGPGRPRKVVTTTAKRKALSTSKKDIVAKVVANTPPATPPKRGRGRPRKAEKSTVFNVFVLDDSASMRESGKTPATISGFNEVLATTKTDKVHTINALVKFSSPGSETWTVGDVKPLGNGFNNMRYYPSGFSTALWDAAGYAIRKTEEAIRTLPIGTRVVMTLFTDGDENSSRHWNRTEVKKLIEEKVALGWVVNFIGAGTKLDVERVATSVGIFAANTMNYQNDGVGATTAFRSMAKSLTNYNNAVADNVDSNVGFFSTE